MPKLVTVLKPEKIDQQARCMFGLMSSFLQEQSD